MDRTIEQFIASETEVADQIIGDLGDALRTGENVDIASTIRSYVLHRFLLADVVSGEEDSIEALANESILHTLEITAGDLDAAGIITGCGGETTWVTKKVKLLFAIQDALGIRFDPRGIARIKTLGDLAAEIDALRHQAGERPADRRAVGNVDESSRAPSVGRPSRVAERQQTNTAQASTLQAGAAQTSAGGQLEKTLPESAAIDVARIRGDFPFLEDAGEAPVYLDNAATMQVPRQVIDATKRFLSLSYANVHRGIYELSERATAAYEHARESIAAFIGARPSNIAFTSGTTASINMVSLSLEDRIGPGDRIVVTAMEHHSNYLPWIRLAKRTGAELKVLPITSTGELSPQRLEEMMEKPTRVIALSHCSNVLGTVNPIEPICARANEEGILTVIDGAQGIRHETLDLAKLGCSWYAFSGHKLMSGPGIGVLYAAADLFDTMEPPFQGGGMVDRIVGSHVEFEKGAHAWEAGTPNIIGAIALEEALAYRESLGFDAVCIYEKSLLDYAESGLEAISRARIIGQPAQRAGCVSFVAEGLRAQDVSQFLATRGICVRAGHHCAIPLHRQLGREASVRISPALYNTFGEIDACLNAIDDCMLP